MENIDWSKAPEGAQYWCEEGWYKSEYGTWSAWSFLERRWICTQYASPENFSWWGSAVARPSASWSSKGLPPVGVACEYNPMPNGKPKKWHRVEVVYSSEWVIVMRCIESPGGHEGGNGVEIAMAVDSCSLEDIRHIRTPEQIAADDRGAAIGGMIDVAAKAIGISFIDVRETELIHALYDAGYRKP